MSPRTPVGRAVLELMQDGRYRFVREIAAAAGVPHETARAACKRLAARGFLELGRLEGIHVYRITEAGRTLSGAGMAPGGPVKGSQAKRLNGSLRARAWRVMRMMPWWAVSDLLMTVSDGGQAGARVNLERYVRALRRAGYLSVSRRDPGRYHLARDTGGLAPALNTAARTLTDPNTGEVLDV